MNMKPQKDVSDIVMKVQIPKGLFSSCLNVSVFDWRCHQIQWLVIQAAQVRRIFFEKEILSMIWNKHGNQDCPKFQNENCSDTLDDKEGCGGL